MFQEAELQHFNCSAKAFKLIAWWLLDQITENKTSYYIFFFFKSTERISDLCVSFPGKCPIQIWSSGIASLDCISV